MATEISILILSGILFMVSIGILISVSQTLKELKGKLNSIKNYEILVHGDDMFLMPEKKITQLYHKYVKRS